MVDEAAPARTSRTEECAAVSEGVAATSGASPEPVDASSRFVVESPSQKAVALSSALDLAGLSVEETPPSLELLAPGDVPAAIGSFCDSAALTSRLRLAKFTRAKGSAALLGWGTWDGERHCVLKVLMREGAKPLPWRLMVQEVKVVRALRRGGADGCATVAEELATVHDDVGCCVVTSRYRGGDLEHHLGTLRSTPPRRLAALCRSWFSGLADALGAIHAARIAHNDVKPANCFLDSLPSGDVIPACVLADFDRSVFVDDSEERFTQGAVERTAPEVATHLALDAPTWDTLRPTLLRSDLWGLGLVAAQLLSGLEAADVEALTVDREDELLYERPPAGDEASDAARAKWQAAVAADLILAPGAKTATSAELDPLRAIMRPCLDLRPQGRPLPGHLAAQLRALPDP